MGGVDLEITRETDWRMKPGPLRKAAVAEFPRMDVDEDARVSKCRGFAWFVVPPTQPHIFV
jgi:hypothetical protein